MLNAEIDRIKKIRFFDDVSRLNSHTFLVKSYLSDIKKWCNLIGNDAQRDPFFDVLKHYQPPVDWLGRTGDLGLPENLNLLMKMVCFWHIHWASTFDLFGSDLRKLKSPYEKLILLFERGGTIQKEEHLVTICDVRIVSVSSWRRMENEGADLEEGKLDDLDDLSVDMIDYSPLLIIKSS